MSTEFRLFAPHDPALDAQLSGDPGSLDATTVAIRQLLDAGETVVLRHALGTGTYRELAHLARWVDDNVAAVAGVRLEIDPARPAGELPDFLTWWRVGIAALCVREVGFEVGDGLPTEARAGLRDHTPEPVGDPHPEEVVTVPRAEAADGWTAALAQVTGTLGGIVRFVNIPKLVLDVPELLAHVQADVRDQGRMKRQAVEQPRVRVDVLGAAPAPGLLEALSQACRDAGAVVVEAGEAEASVALVGVDAEPGSFRGVLPLAAQAADDPDEALSLLRQRLETEDELIPPGLAVPAFTADLWLVDMRPLGLVAAACDPVPLDGLLLELARVEPAQTPWLPPASPWLEPEKRIPGGELPAALQDRPEQLRERLGARVPPSRPLVILGIASTTLANHAAVLLVDGQCVAAVQEERLRRTKQLGWHPPGRRGVTVVSDPTIKLEATWPKRSVAWVLQEAGLTLDDVDIIAYNGVPARWFPTYSLTDPARPPVTIRDGRRIFVPHHLAHAASAHRVSGHVGGHVFTVDGRGERETAAFFDVDDRGALHRVFDIRCGSDSLIGGVYEVITNILGFGHHGAGSTMGLASLGQPGDDLTAFLSARSRDDFTIHDRGIDAAFGHVARPRHAPVLETHTRLAASAQAALEDTVVALIKDGLGGRPATQLSLAGGVALNCSMNQRIRAELSVEDLFIQPAANDAGTALGAALEAHWTITGDDAPRMEHACLGPAYDNARICGALTHFGLPWSTPGDLPLEVAQRLAAGQVVCWFQGRLEFGPRALGARSILADPRQVEMRERVNVLKGRQWWRPFGPSVLAGREADWFEAPTNSPFMLLTLPVRPERQGEIAAVVHVDGTSRPQSVHAEVSPRYHATIAHFERLTGVPMVLNTSFNTAFEPIVCTPEDAIASFLHLGADVLAIGDQLVERSAMG